jgi:hypothetical protein
MWAYHGSNSRRIGATVGKPSGERPDQIAIGVEPKNLEPGHLTLVEALPVVIQVVFAMYRSWRNTLYSQTDVSVRSID